MERDHQRAGRRRCRPGRRALAVSLLVTAALGVGSDVGATVADDPLAPQPLAERATITLVLSAPIEAYLHLLMADALGEFEKENLDVRMEFVPAAESPILVAQGAADVMASTLSAGLYNLIAGGSELRAVAGGPIPSPDAYEGFWVRRDVLGDDGFQPSDIVDEDVSTPFGAASGIFGSFIRQADEIEPGVLTAQTLNHRVLPLADGVMALQNGGVNVAMAVQPLSIQLSQHDCCEFIGLWPDYSTVVIMFGPTLLHDDPESGEAFTRALARTVRDHMSHDYRADPDLAPLAAEMLGQPLESFVEGVTPEWSVVLWNEFFHETQSYFFDLGDVLQYDEPLDIGQVYDTRFLDAIGVETL